MDSLHVAPVLPSVAEIEEYHKGTMEAIAKVDRMLECVQPQFELRRGVQNAPNDIQFQSRWIPPPMFNPVLPFVPEAKPLTHGEMLNSVTEDALKERFHPILDLAIARASGCGMFSVDLTWEILEGSGFKQYDILDAALPFDKWDKIKPEGKLRIRHFVDDRFTPEIREWTKQQKMKLYTIQHAYPNIQICVGVRLSWYHDKWEEQRNEFATANAAKKAGRYFWRPEENESVNK